MKKLFALLMAVMMVFAVAAAAAEEATEPAPAQGMITGGWTPAEDPAVTEELQAVFEKGTEGLLGVGYTPVAFLGSQVVAGTNYAFLCQARVVYPDAKPTFVVVFLYKDLSGNVSVLSIADFDFGALCEY